MAIGKHSEQTKPNWLLPIKEHPIRFISIFAIYLILARLSVQITIFDSPISPIWLPAGFSLAMIFIYGHKSLLGIFSGALISSALDFLFSSGPIINNLALTLSFTAINTLQPYLIYHFLVALRALSTRLIKI